MPEEARCLRVSIGAGLFKVAGVVEGVEEGAGG